VRHSLQGIVDLQQFSAQQQTFMRVMPFEMILSPNSPGNKYRLTLAKVVADDPGKFVISTSA
jgi:hypothetical protein